MKIGENEKIFDKKEYISILDDRYILTKKIGKGATSVIYMGYDSYEEEEKYYAFKISPNIEMIENEAKFLSIIPPNKNTITYYSKHSDAKMVKKTKKTKITFNCNIYKMVHFLIIYTTQKRGLGKILPV